MVARETFVRQLLKRPSDLFVSEDVLTPLDDVLTTAKTLVDAMDGVAAKKTSICLGCSESVCRYADVSKVHYALQDEVLHGFKAV